MLSPHRPAYDEAVDSEQQRRPDPARWIWYAVGGSLGPRYREWVLRDVTGRGRWWRQLVRALVPLVPIAIVLFAVLGATWMTWVALLGGVFIALIYSAAYIDQAADHRLLKHGYPLGTAERVRDEAGLGRTADDVSRYEQNYRAQRPSPPPPPAA